MENYLILRSDRSEKDSRNGAIRTKSGKQTSGLVASKTRVESDLPRCSEIHFHFNVFTAFSTIRGRIWLRISIPLSWMCFPSKKQKALYSDEATKQAPPPPDTKAPEPAAPTSSTAPVISTTPANTSSQMAPNVAIVIYTMYGHIAKCSYPISYPLYFVSFIFLYSG